MDGEGRERKGGKRGEGGGKGMRGGKERRGGREGDERRGRRMERRERESDR